MAEIIQADRSEAIRKILNGVRCPNTVYIWLDNTAADTRATMISFFSECSAGPIINKRKHELYFCNGSEIWFRSANNAENLHGLRFHGAVITTKIDDLSAIAMQSCLTSTKGWLLLVNDDND